MPRPRRHPGVQACLAAGKEFDMDLDLGVGGLIAGIITIIVGIIIIAWPRIIAYVIGIWLIIVGVIAIINAI